MKRPGCLSALFALLILGNADAAPVRLARHPDYHNGKIAFSYLGDIWTADYLVDEEELHSVMMMMMIGDLNASHTGVSGGWDNERPPTQTRYPGFDLVADPSGYYRVGHIYRYGPDKEYLKIRKGDYIIAIDGPRYADREGRAGSAGQA